jgi:hypothetical protein
MATRQDIRIAKMAMLSELRKIDVFTSDVIRWGKRQIELKEEQEREQFRKLSFFKRQIFRVKKYFVERKTRQIMR